MNELTLDSFARRLNRLEREVHRWRLGATMLLICIIAVVVMGQTLPKPQVIEAQRFVLKDPEGKVRAIYINRGGVSIGFEARKFPLIELLQASQDSEITKASTAYEERCKAIPENPL